jgi:sulfur transfer complex TusBCD TusB component (DsrH family)
MLGAPSRCFKIDVPSNLKIFMVEASRQKVLMQRVPQLFLSLGNARVQMVVNRTRINIYFQTTDVHARTYKVDCSHAVLSSSA